MVGHLRNFFDNRRPPQKGRLPTREPSAPVARPAGNQRDRGQSFSKVFRYVPPDGQLEDPKIVQVVGSFSKWKRVDLLHDGRQDTWHATVHHIPGNRTHHYMLLVDGKPTFDRTCDGLAVPHGPQEEQYQVDTDKGPRVLMMFAQTR